MNLSPTPNTAQDIVNGYLRGRITAEDCGKALDAAIRRSENRAGVEAVRNVVGQLEPVVKLAIMPHCLFGHDCGVAREFWYRKDCTGLSNSLVKSIAGLVVGPWVERDPDFFPILPVVQAQRHLKFVPGSQLARQIGDGECKDEERKESAAVKESAVFVEQGLNGQEAENLFGQGARRNVDLGAQRSSGFSSQPVAPRAPTTYTRPSASTRTNHELTMAGLELEALDHAFFSGGECMSLVPSRVAGRRR